MFDRGGQSAQVLLSKLAVVDPKEVSTTIITYEEQMRGWLSYTARSRPISEQIAAYKKLEDQLATYQQMQVISFDERAGELFVSLKRMYPRLGTMDLKIAAITMVHQATLLTRNTKDFGQIQGIIIEDWTA